MKYLQLLLLVILSSSIFGQGFYFEKTHDIVVPLPDLDVDQDGDPCEIRYAISQTIKTKDDYECINNEVFDIIVYIDLWGDGTYDLEYNSFLPPNDLSIDDTNGNGIPDIYIPQPVNNTPFKIKLLEIIGPSSNHKIKWSAYDRCYNIRSFEQAMLILDKTPPQVVAKDTTIQLPNSFTPVTINAKEMVMVANDNCSEKESLYYSFSADNFSPTMDVYCHHAASSQPIFIYVSDEGGNTTALESKINIESWDPCGDPSASYNLWISDVYGNSLNEQQHTAEIELLETGEKHVLEAIDDEISFFLFHYPPPFTLKVLIVKKEEINVDIYDLVALHRHISGIALFESNEQYLAADVNLDRQINSTDLLLLRKHLLGILPLSNDFVFVNRTVDLDLLDPSTIYLDENFNETVEQSHTFGSRGISFTAIELGNIVK